jgi:hypothetical protein
LGEATQIKRTGFWLFLQKWVDKIANH